MRGFSNFAISFSIISILTGAVTLYGHGLTMGGPAEMAFGWPLVTVFTLTVAMSMAELASALPTAGAMYHWSSRLGGKGWGWFTAWFNIAKLDHSWTTAVCGIHNRGKRPEVAVEEIARLVRAMFEQQCSGVMLRRND